MTNAPFTRKDDLLSATNQVLWVYEQRKQELSSEELQVLERASNALHRLAHGMTTAGLVGLHNELQHIYMSNKLNAADAGWVRHAARLLWDEARQALSA